MGLYMLNISVDTTDPYPDHIQENLSFNDQESIVEIVIEKFLGYEDAIPEYDDCDTRDHIKKPIFKIEFVPLKEVAVNTKSTLCGATKQRFPNYDGFLLNGFLKIDVPPPKI